MGFEINRKLALEIDNKLIKYAHELACEECTDHEVKVALYHNKLYREQRDAGTLFKYVLVVHPKVGEGLESPLSFHDTLNEANTEATLWDNCDYQTTIIYRPVVEVVGAQNIVYVYALLASEKFFFTLSAPMQAAHLRIRCTLDSRSWLEKGIEDSIIEGSVRTLNKTLFERLVVELRVFLSETYGALYSSSLHEKGVRIFNSSLTSHKYDLIEELESYTHSINCVVEQESPHGKYHGTYNSEHIVTGHATRYTAYENCDSVDFMLADML